MEPEVEGEDCEMKNRKSQSEDSSCNKVPNDNSGSLKGVHLGKAFGEC